MPARPISTCFTSSSRFRWGAGDWATQDAEWTPTDPAKLVEDADIDDETGELRCRLSGGSLFDVKPTAQEAPMIRIGD